jgi:hypothetical protein
VTKVVDVDLPRPRSVETRESPRYFNLITEVREALRGSEGGSSEATLASPERTAAEGGIG